MMKFKITDVNGKTFIGEVNSNYKYSIPDHLAYIDSVVFFEDIKKQHKTQSEIYEELFGEHYDRNKKTFKLVWGDDWEEDLVRCCNQYASMFTVNRWKEQYVS